jgi:hypothetical protein
MEDGTLPALHGTVSTASATVDGRCVWGGGGYCTLGTVSVSSVFAEGRGVCAREVHSGGPGWASVVPRCSLLALTSLPRLLLRHINPLSPRTNGVGEEQLWQPLGDGRWGRVVGRESTKRSVGRSHVWKESGLLNWGRAK